MELKRYLRILMAHWWIVLLTFLSTLGAVLMLTLGQTPMYRSVGSYVVKTNLSDTDARQLPAALEVLSRGQVGQTVAEMANSQVVRAQAADTLGLAGGQMPDISVNARLLTGTNVVEIEVNAPYPALARDFASGVGTYTATFVKRVYGMYELEMLDDPGAPSSPATPKTALNLLLGAVAGLVLGAGLALLSAYLRTPTEGNKPEPGPALGRAAEPVVEVAVAGAATGTSASLIPKDGAGAVRYYAFPEESRCALDAAEPVVRLDRRSHLPRRRNATLY